MFGGSSGNVHICKCREVDHQIMGMFLWFQQSEAAKELETVRNNKDREVLHSTLASYRSFSNAQGCSLLVW